jgi:hypothetical protein
MRGTTALRRLGDWSMVDDVVRLVRVSGEFVRVNEMIQKH